MTFLPIVERELRREARRPYTYWTRFGAALVTIVVAAWIWFGVADGQPEHARGQILFQVLSGLAFAYALFAGIEVTSDCLSQEKREGTLGLLFLTDLKGYDVVLGKLTATSLHTLYRVMAILPLLTIPLLLGGVSLDEIGRMALVLVNTLFFSLSAGMFASACSQRDRQAMAGALLLVLTAIFAPPLVAWVLRRSLPALAMPGAWLLVSAASPVVLALAAVYKGHALSFWLVLGVVHVAGWLFLIVSSMLARSVWQDRPGVGRQGRYLEAWRQWQFGNRGTRNAYRTRLLDSNPIYWLAARDRLKPAYVMALLASLVLCWMWLYLKFGRSMLDWSVYLLIIYVVHTALKLWFGSEACRLFGEDRRSGALELIVSTPLDIDQILEGGLMALKRQFFLPVACVLGADLIMLVAGNQDRVMDAANDWLLMCLGLIAMFVADLYTLAWVGMWLGLTTPKTSRATRSTVARVLVAPWALFILGLTLLTLIPGIFDPSDTNILGAGFALALVNDAVLLGWARNNLRQSFRSVVSESFNAPTHPTPSPKVETSDAAALPAAASQ